MLYSLKPPKREKRPSDGDPQIAPSESRGDRSGESVSIKELALTLKPHVNSRGSLLISLIDTLDVGEKEQFSYELASYSTDTELLYFDLELLKKMSEALNSWTIWYNAGNARQQLRVDAAIEGKKLAQEFKLNCVIAV